jgi:hypothetical protein
MTPVEFKPGMSDEQRARELLKRLADIAWAVDKEQAITAALAEARAEALSEVESVIESFDVATANFSPQQTLATLLELVVGLRANQAAGRFIPCRGCPTRQCTCMTELEADLLEKNSDLQDELRTLARSGKEQSG